MSTVTTTPGPAQRSESWTRRGCAIVVAGVAAYSSYAHQREFALAGGADAVTSALWPLSVDGLVILASIGLLRQRAETSRRARWAVRSAFLVGVVVSLAANVAAAPALQWQPIMVAGWPPMALLLAIELVLHGRQNSQVTSPYLPAPAIDADPRIGTSRPGHSESDAPVAEPSDETTTPVETPRRTLAAAISETTAPTAEPRCGALARSADQPSTEHATERTQPRSATRGSRARSRPTSATTLVAVKQGVSHRRTDRTETAEEVMWSHYQLALADGCTPTGAELDRVAGTSNYGRAVLARWRRTGRLPPPSDPNNSTSCEVHQAAEQR